MKKPIAVTLLVFVLAVNGWFIYHARSVQKSGKDKLAAAAQEAASQQAEQERAADKRKEKVVSLITDWEAATSVPLLSDHLLEKVRTISWDGYPLLNQPVGLLSKSDLNNAQLEDLDFALAGFLRAYAESNPQSVIEYMRERGLEFDVLKRAKYEAALKRKGVNDLESLSDEEIFARFWAVNRCRTGWYAFKSEPSARLVWNGHGFPINAILSLAGIEGTNTPVADLFKDLTGVMTLGRSFRPQEGSLEGELRQPQVLLCDVRLILEYDDKLSHAQAAYLLRFWFNHTASKWEPIALVAFGSGVDRRIIPKLQF